MITINGVERDSPETSNLAELLKEQGYAQDRVVVELNRAVVPKKDYASATIRDGDTIEILNFVSGG
jgi:sulfur carrier protein